MTRFISAPVRTLALAFALALTAPTAVAYSTAPSTEPTRTGDVARPASDGIPLDGWLIIAGIVVAVIVLAWVCSRVSDS